MPVETTNAPSAFISEDNPEELQSNEPVIDETESMSKESPVNESESMPKKEPTVLVPM